MSIRECEVTGLAREVLARSVVSRSSEELVAAVAESETAIRVLQAAQMQWVAEIERRGIPARQGARNVKSWLQQCLRMSGPEADARVKVARAVNDRVSPDGQRLPAELPVTGAALRNGTIGWDHARAVADGIRTVTGVLSPQQCVRAETLLVEQARVVGPAEIRALAEGLRYQVDQDGAFRAEEQQFDARELHYAVARDGMTVLKARLDRETGATLGAVLEPLAAPRPEQDGEKDPRTAGQRHADALADVLDIALSTERVPRTGGQRPHLTVTVWLQTLQQRLTDYAPAMAVGALETTGQPLTAAQIRRLACDCAVLPMVLGGESQPLDVGRAERTAPPHIRAALLVRDGQCSFPNCDRPPGTPEAHHVVSWLDGGQTSLSNMTMLCAAHHRMVHNQGWRIDLTTGKPWFIPPSTIDPRRRPRPGNRPLHQIDIAPLISA